MRPTVRVFLLILSIINFYSVLLVIGVQLTRLIESNTLTKEADGDALAFFESYAATIKHNCATAAIVYLRVLFLYLEKERSSRLALDAFTRAAATHPEAARTLLAADSSLRQLLERRVNEDRLVKQRQEQAAAGHAPRIVSSLLRASK